jgi:hypothetical protein
MCVNALLRRFARSIAGSILTNILERLNDMPALEYARCLAAIIPCFTEVTVTSCIIPLISRFVAKQDAYQYVIGELVTSVDLKFLHVTVEMFSQFMLSRILVNEYMLSLIRLAERSGCVTDDWIHRIFVGELVQAASHNRQIRIGAVRVVLALSDSIPAKPFFSHMVTLFRWATESVDIGIALLSKADEIMTPRTIHLFPDFRELLVRICQTPDLEARIQLPSIVRSNPTVFLGNGVNLEPVLKMLAGDRSPEMRGAFLDDFATLFAKSSAADIQNALFQLFLQSFEDPAPSIRTRLIAIQISSVLGPVRVFEAAPLFVELLRGISEWRSVQQAVDTYLTFSPEILISLFPTVTPIVFDLVGRSPHALSETGAHYAGKMAGILDEPSCSSFVDSVIETFFKSDSFSIRRIGPILAAAIAIPSLNQVLGERLFTVVADLALDPVMAVRASILPALVSFRRYYKRQGDSGGERKTIALYMSFSKVTDPLIESKWSQNAIIFNAPLQSEPKKIASSKSHSSVPLLEPSQMAAFPTHETGSNPGKGFTPSPAMQRILATKHMGNLRSGTELPPLDVIGRGRVNWGGSAGKFKLRPPP